MIESKSKNVSIYNSSFQYREKVLLMYSTCDHVIWCTLAILVMMENSFDYKAKKLRWSIIIPFKKLTMQWIQDEPENCLHLPVIFSINEIIKRASSK